MRSLAHLLERLPRRLILWRSFALSLLAVLLLVALAGCGGTLGGGESSDGLERVTLTLDWYPNADHAGIYAAQAEGYFEEAGLEVEIQ